MGTKQPQTDVSIPNMLQCRSGLSTLPIRACRKSCEIESDKSDQVGSYACSAVHPVPTQVPVVVCLRLNGLYRAFYKQALPSVPYPHMYHIRRDVETILVISNSVGDQTPVLQRLDLCQPGLNQHGTDVLLDIFYLVSTYPAKDKYK